MDREIMKNNNTNKTKNLICCSCMVVSQKEGSQKIRKDSENCN